MTPTLTATIYIRRGGEVRPYAIDESVTIGQLLSEYGKGCQMIHAQRDVFKRVVRTVPVDRKDPAIKYCRPPREEEEVIEDSYSTKDDESSENSLDETTGAMFNECDLWVVDKESRIRVFFNPYTRMVLGLPVWFLDLYCAPSDHILELELLLRACLTLGPQENRFALYGNYRSHCSMLVGSANALALVREEDAENSKFFQYMMLPEHETQAHLGITRQSALLLHETGLTLGSKRFWFALQGTSLFYFKSPTDRGWKKAITNIDECQIIYRGGNNQKTSYSFDIVETDGTAHRCKSHSKRRVEKWVKCLQRCHTSREINEPITMEMIDAMTAAQETPPLFEARKKIRDRPEKEETNVLEETQNAEADHERWINDVERMLKQVELGSEALLSRKKPRRKEVSVWIESIRTFLLSILQMESGAFACKVVPEVQTLVTDIINFASIVEGRSEFVPSNTLNSDCIDGIMDSINGLFALFRNEAMEAAVIPEETRDHDGRSAMIKIRRALRKPIMKAKIGKINTAPPKAKKAEGKGFLDWINRVTNKKTKIPETEAKELSITERDPNEVSGSKPTSARSSRVPSQPDSRVASAPQTPKPEPQADTKKSFWSRINLAKHFRSDSNLSETAMTESEVDLESMANKFKKNQRTSEPKTLEVEESPVVWSRPTLTQPPHASNSRMNSISKAPPSTLRTVVDETKATDRSEFGSIIDQYDPNPSEFGSPWISTTHKAQDSLGSHRRSSSLRVPPHATVPRDNQRRRSVVEVDQKFAKMAPGKAVDTDLTPFVEMECNICHLKVVHPSELKKTPFAAFHSSCLQCNSCGEPLTTLNFRLEAGKSYCRNECSMAAPGQATPLRSCLKKPSRFTQA
ncbi:hypothetical protein PSACC_02647 [Paramicrosporidium saccamoebae]|uniref:LIM zinc-binding domain-containing protein n=1 Tax=Paramicrosporidium saccamoebae TaxID=1246581 RepID=A0A2H9TIH2_9FUNG|nr:hypothetical protein PSACC_02647 [Paramicrosporidium saccamoebae]